MATRSTIALEFADGSVGVVYCHYDGYLDHNGQILRDHWSDPFKLQKLIDMGDLSSLGAELGEKHDFDSHSSWHNTCLFYGRDRDESDVDAQYFRDYNEYLISAQFEEYNYILRRDGRWYVDQYGEFSTLDQALTEEDCL